MQAQIAAWFDTALWFWIAAALLWWHVCSATLGVPNDLLLRSARDSEDAALFDRLARRNAAVVAAAWRRGGALGVGLGAFLVMFTGAHAVANRSPSAAGAFCLLAPLALHLWASARAAAQIETTQPGEEALRRRFAALRLRAFASALASVALAGAVRGAARVAALG